MRLAIRAVREARQADRRIVGLVLAAATLGFAVIQLDIMSVVNVAVKPIGAALGRGVAGLQWEVLDGTVALVTGASSGIGAARRQAGRGCDR